MPPVQLVPNRPSSAVVAPAKREEKDVKCLNEALQSERTRLLDMIKTLQKRLDGAHSRLLEQENQLLEQKRLNSRLEKDLEKTKTDLNNVKNRTGQLRVTFRLLSLARRASFFFNSILLMMNKCNEPQD